MSQPLETAVGELLDWGLVDPGAVVDGDLRVTSVARRNLSLRVERRHGPSYLVKRPDPVSNTSGETLERERRFYASCAADPAARPIRELLPARGPEVPDPTALVLELVDGAASLWQLTRARQPPVPRPVFAALGAAVGRLHETFAARDRAGDELLASLEEGPPEVLRIHRPVPWTLRKATGARLELLRLIQQQADLVRGLEAAQEAWRDATLVHGDLRFDNVLVRLPAAGDGPELRLVDWEFVRWGDPAWDLAALLRECLLLWLRSMSMRPDLDPAERAATATVPLAQVRRAARAVWHGYGGAVSGELAAARGRSLRLLGASLLQPAWEHTESGQRLSSFGVQLLQLSANLLGGPGEAASGLLDLPLGPAGS